MYVKAKVFVNARAESVKEIGEHRYEIRVKEKAERNMANTRVLQIVAGLYHVPEGAVRIFSGHHSPSKLITIVYNT